jgi:hypothetical protein
MAVRPEGMIGDKSWVDRAGFVVANGANASEAITAAAPTATARSFILPNTISRSYLEDNH